MPAKQRHFAKKFSSCSFLYFFQIISPPSSLFFAFERMMSKQKEAAIKDTLSFIYKREEPSGPNAYQDPDKVTVVRSQKGIHQLPKDEMVDDFTGEYEVFHPGYPTTVCLVHEVKTGDGPGERLVETYPSFEHALQASKLLIPNDREQLRQIPASTQDTVRDVRRYVNKIKDDTTRVMPQTQWNEQCLTIAMKLLRDKFMRNKQAKISLMKTEHKVLIYVNSYNDQFWGTSSSILDKNTGKFTSGHKNHLGKLLEDIRREIDHGDDIEHWIADHIVLPKVDRVRVTVFTDGQTPDGLEGERDEPIAIPFKPIIYFGKADFNDVRCQHPSISRVHAAIVTDAKGRTHCVDFQSTHGTKINGVTNVHPPFTFITLTTIDSTGTPTLQLGQYPRPYKIRIDFKTDSAIQAELLHRIADESKTRDSGIVGNGSDEGLTVFVRGLPPEATEESLRKFFQVCGRIKELSIPLDKRTGNNKGIAFVTFSSTSEVLQAIGRDGDSYYGVYLKIRKSDASKGNNGGQQKGGTGQRESQKGQRESVGHYGPGGGGPGGVSSVRGERDGGKERGRDSRFPDDRERDRERVSDRERRRDDSRDRDRERDRKRVDSRERGRERDRERDRQRDDSRKRERESKRPSRFTDRRSVSPSASPPRKQSTRKPSLSRSPSPPRRPSERESERQRSPSHNESPPRRPTQRGSPSPSPPRRPALSAGKKPVSPSPSPPRRPTANKAITRSPSSSPPRRPTVGAAVRDASESPPRRPVTRRDSPSPSPPRRPAATTTVAASSGMKRERDRDSSESPPRRPVARRDSPSSSPPRRPIALTNRRDDSSSPPRRPAPSVNRRDDSNSPPRRPRANS